MRLHSRTATVAVALLALTLAGCTSGDGDAEQPDDVATEAPADEPDDASAPGAGGDLEARLIALEEIAIPGFSTQPSDDDDPSVDDKTGGACVFDFTDVMPAEMQATEVGRSFGNEELMSFVAESAWSGPTAEDVVAQIAQQLAACSGPYEGTSGDASVAITSEPVEIAVPGSTVSACRYYEATIDGEVNTYGPMCVAASGERVLALMVNLLSDDVGVSPEQHSALLATAATKLFAE